MNPTLSQDEVHALLQGIADGDIGVPAEPAPRGEVCAYDLVGEARPLARGFPALDGVHERLARRLRMSLGTLLGSLPTIAVGECATLPHETFRNRLTTPASLHLFTMEPLRGQAVLVVSPALAFALVDRVFGGAGRTPATLADREPSPIEAQMIQRVVARVLTDLTEAWAPVQRLECRFVRSESDPAALKLAAADDVVLAVELRCDIGSGDAPLTLAIPAAVLEPLRVRLAEPQGVAPAAGGDRAWAAAMSAAVRATEVTLSAELGGRDISARELLRLRVGDVLPLGIHPDDPLVVRVEGVSLMTALPGVSRGNNAVRLLARE